MTIQDRRRPGPPAPHKALPQNFSARPSLAVPLGAALLAGSLGHAMAQEATATRPQSDNTLSTVVVREKAETAQGRDSLKAETTSIGRGAKSLRDVPQSVTVVTEKLIDDRHLDTVKEALKNTAGITFQAAEGGEEDIRLRGFALQSTGDLFIDGMRDPAIYDRDTFNLDRMEVLRGSASMMFGRGSTGGAVNQVSKTPQLMDESQIDLTLGNHKYVRMTGDFNVRTSDSAGVRINAMVTKADNNGAGSRIDKRGLAAAYRWGIGERDEFQASLYHLENDNGINYGMPYVAPSEGSASRSLLPLDPDTYYGAASDYNHGSADIVGFDHKHRFDHDSELTTKLRIGHFERDQRAGAIRICQEGISRRTGLVTNVGCPTSVTLDNFGAGTALTRGTHLKVQDMDIAQIQSDFTKKFNALGFKHDLIAGVDATREKRTVYAARSAAQGGVDLAKPNTLVGTPDDGARVNESARRFRVGNQYVAQGLGAFVQDTVEVAPHWKVVGGIRYDHLRGDYDIHSIPDDASGPASTQSYRMKVSEWSPRVGLLYQPTPLLSFHASAGTSFNTSGDSYSLGADNVDTPPEKSANVELGAKIDSADKRFSSRLALFHSTKYNERNTDPDRPVTTLSGKRHVAGVELDFAGRLNSRWEVFASYMWMPVARVDKAAPCPVEGRCAQGTPGERPGDRPALTPKHSGTVWTTYQFTPRLRVGAGLNFRSKQSPTRVEWQVPGYVTADLMAEYALDFERWIIKANLTNVTNKLYGDQLYPGHYVPGAGRQLQVTASLKF